MTNAEKFVFCIVGHVISLLLKLWWLENPTILEKKGMNQNRDCEVKIKNNIPIACELLVEN